MHATPYIKAGLLATALLIICIAGWEVYLREQGYLLSYNDDEALWAYQHQKVYNASTSGPVLIGSSRIKFGIDLATWKATTGAAPTQLAMVGTSPRPLLADLARDERFKGTVVVDITEGLFFTPTGSFPEQQANKGVAYYPKWSLAQQAGFHIGRVLESKLVFLDEERFALRNLIKRLRIADRPGVFALPPFPLKFTIDDMERQTFITPDFLADTSMQNEQRAIWMYIFTKAPRMPMPDSVLSGIFSDTRAAVEKIQARGGKVIFIRMPSTGDVWELEKQAFPRALYWDRLLKETGAPGIHFEDYPQLSRYDCPEWSHLAPADAITFTRDLIHIMEQKTSWPFLGATSVPARSQTSTLTVP
jgi:hypothetical protein